MVSVKDFSNSLILPEPTNDYRKDMEKIYANIKKKLKISLEYHDNLDANIQEINLKLDGKCPNLIF